jgi:hypothetical protein
VASREILEKYPVEVIRGYGSCTWVSPEIALEFAKYLSASLHCVILEWIHPTNLEDSEERREDDPEGEENNSTSQEDRESQIKIWNGVPIQRRVLDGYISATAMAKIYGKKFYDYSKTDRAIAYMHALSSLIRILQHSLFRDDYSLLEIS